MGYHVWKYSDTLRRSLVMETTKTLSKWDKVAVPAFWEKRSAANSWLKSQSKRDGQTPEGGMVLKCTCSKGQGMGRHV